VSVRTALPALLVVAAAGVAIALAATIDTDDAQCGSGFTAKGARCVPAGSGCPPPLEMTPHGCDAPPARVSIPAARISVGSSDWEAEGRVAPRTIETHAFAIDRFEVTVGAAACPSCPLANDILWATGDRARAMSGVSFEEAERICAARRGRLLTEDEWIVASAAAGSAPPLVGASAAAGSARERTPAGPRPSDEADRAPRYPWGETGAVCRRAAWGLANGPCSKNGHGPDTVGAHPDGATPLGVEDMAGNVAEWVRAGDGRKGVARGGSWASALVTELRTWARLEIDPAAHDPRVGVRCAYDAP
jgi:formylglycine-generating enzyme required for sulfatase activity